jgi:FtsZ-interacting cell division protein ZipA
LFCLQINSLIPRFGQNLVYGANIRLSLIHSDGFAFGDDVTFHRVEQRLAVESAGNFSFVSSAKIWK